MHSDGGKYIDIVVCYGNTNERQPLQLWTCEWNGTIIKFQKNSRQQQHVQAICRHFFTRANQPICCAQYLQIHSDTQTAHAPHYSFPQLFVPCSCLYWENKMCSRVLTSFTRWISNSLLRCTVSFYHNTWCGAGFFIAFSTHTTMCVYSSIPWPKNASSTLPITSSCRSTFSFGINGKCIEIESFRLSVIYSS